METTYENKFKAFCDRALTTKHAIWFDQQPIYRKRNLYQKWHMKKRYVESKKQTASFRKFLYEMRENPLFRIPKQKLRKNIIKSILS